MPSDITGHHHISALAGTAAGNLPFYTQTLGLRPERLAAEARCSLLLVRKGERRAEAGDAATADEVAPQHAGV